MVYEKKCSECGKIIDFGGEDPEESDYGKGLPENAIRFNDKLYCQECVKSFVEFGTGGLLEKISELEENLDDIMKELGMEKNLNTD